MIERELNKILDEGIIYPIMQTPVFMPNLKAGDTIQFTGIKTTKKPTPNYFLFKQDPCGFKKMISPSSFFAHSFNEILEHILNQISKRWENKGEL